MSAYSVTISPDVEEPRRRQVAHIHGAVEIGSNHGYLRGSGYVPSEFEQRVFEDHWKIIGFSALFAFGASEVQGYLLRRMRAAPFINAPFQALIAELAQRAGLRFTPAIIFISQGPVTRRRRKASSSAARCW